MTTARALATIALVTFAGIMGCAQPRDAADTADTGAAYFENANHDATCGFALEIGAGDVVANVRETGVGIGPDCDAAYDEAREVATAAAISSAACDGDTDIVRVSAVRTSFDPDTGVSVEVDVFAGCVR